MFSPHQQAQIGKFLVVNIVLALVDHVEDQRKQEGDQDY